MHPTFRYNPNISEISWPHFVPFNYSLAGIPHGWFCGSVLDPRDVSVLDPNPAAAWIVDFLHDPTNVGTFGLLVPWFQPGKNMEESGLDTRGEHHF